MTSPAPYANVGGMPLRTRGRVGFVQQNTGVFMAYVAAVRPPPVMSGGPLSVGLLVRQPNPEGTKFKELDAPGYERQPIVLELNAAFSIWTNSARIAFGPVTPDWVKANFLAIFDGDQMLCYGAVVTHISGGRPIDVVEFWPHKIEMRARAAASP